MILFTIGTSEPFDRLVRVADDVAGAFDERTIVQAGRSNCTLRSAEFVDFMPYEDLRASIASARAVVTHAGVGSVLLSLAEGARPIVVPRLRQYGEAVDDHQLAFARRLDSLGLVHLVEDPSRLVATIIATDQRRRRPDRSPPPLALALRERLERLLGSTHRENEVEAQ